jgi:excinuclease ABC subunit C
VLLSHEIAGRRLLAEALSLRAGHKIRVEAPQRGEKRELVSHALVNAREALARRLAESSSQAAIFARLAELFDLEESPERVEVFDNSHISGTNPVGAMIVAGPEGFMRNQYRKFNMRSEDLAPGRLRHDAGNADTAFQQAARDKDLAKAGPRPISLIDGGSGQLSAAGPCSTSLGLARSRSPL